MAARTLMRLLVVVVLFNLIGAGASPAFASSLQCGSMTDLGIPGLVNRRFSVSSLPCFRVNIPAGLTRLRVYVWTRDGILNLYMGQTQSSLPALVIDTSRTSGARVTRNQAPFRPRGLTRGFLVLALGPSNGSVEGDIVRVKSEIYEPPPAPAPSSDEGISRTSDPLELGAIVDLSPVSVVTKRLGKAQPPVVVAPPEATQIEVVNPAVPTEPAAPVESAAPAAQPVEVVPSEQPASEEPLPAAPQQQPQPAANTDGIDPFPCSRAGIGISNLCIEQPYPARRGSTAYVVWSITDFSYGEFDRGDGQGFKGPIYNQQRVDVPGIEVPRTIRLRWLNKAGEEHIDTFTIQVVD